MNANRDLERRLADFYMTEAPERAPNRVLAEVLATTDATRQRRVFISVPWRVPTMNTYPKVALAAVAVIAVGALGLSMLGNSRPGGPGGAPTASPSSIPTPSPSPITTASPTASPFTPPALTEKFTSERNGFSISYPAGWVARPATVPWTTGVPDYISTAGDVFYDPVHEGGLWIAVASRQIGASTPEAWLAETLALEDACEASQPIAVDGVSGLIGALGCNRAVVAADGRGYSFWLYTSDELSAAYDVLDRAWFEEVLATVQLQPGDAVD